MKISVPLLVVLLVPITSLAQLHINEIMFKPIETGFEFVELVNYSSMDTIDLCRFSISDNKSSFPPLSGVLLPGQMAVLTANIGIPDSIINQINEAGNLLLVLNGSRLGNGLGNEADQLTILSLSDSTIYEYVEWEVKSSFGYGYSLEKIHPECQQTEAEQDIWQISRTIGGSPGQTNTVYTPIIDLSIDTIQTSGPPFYPSDSLHLTYTLSSLGWQIPETSFFSIGIDQNDNGDLDQNEIIQKSSIFKDDWVSGQLELIPVLVAPDTGKAYILAQIETTGDENLRNNESKVAVNITRKPTLHLSMGSIEPLYSAYFAEMDTLHLRFDVQNLSSHFLEDILIQLKMDHGSENVNTNPQLINLAEHEVKTIQQTVVFPHSGLWELELTAQVDNEKVNLDSNLIFDVRPKNPLGMLRFNEIMYNPEGSDGFNEFIEIVNISNTDTIFLSDLVIQKGSYVYQLVFTEEQLLFPGELGLILHPHYFDQDEPPYLNLENRINGFTDPILPLKNTSDQLELRSAFGHQIDSVEWTNDTGDGYSFERVHPTLTGMESWKKSVQKGGTPGNINSNLLDPFSIEVVEMLTHVGSDEISLSLSFVYTGYEKVDHYFVTILDSLHALLTQNPEILQQEYQSPLVFGKQFQFHYQLPVSYMGNINLKILIETDDKRFNYQIPVSQILPISGQVLRINEFLPISNHFPEYVELFNSSSVPVNLESITIQNNSSSAATVSHPYLLLGGDVVAIFRESDKGDFDRIPQKIIVCSKLPTFKNEGDQIRIYNQNGSIHDSLDYTFWLESNNVEDYSFERLDPVFTSQEPENWRLSDLKGGTPGFHNSAYAFTHNLKLVAPSEIFINRMETISIPIQVQNMGMDAIQQFSVSVFEDNDGNLQPDSPNPFHQISYNGPPVSTFYPLSLILDHSLLISQKYLIKCLWDLDEYPADNQAVVSVCIQYLRNDLQLSEFMVNPIQDPYDGMPDMPEYIEFYNPSDRVVPLYEWCVADKEKETGESYKTYFCDSVEVQPFSYFVLATDSSIFTYWPYLTESGFEEKIWITPQSDMHFNSSSDDIRLFDRYGRIIDSLSYDESWHSPLLTSTKGIALERRSFAVETVNAKNWGSSSQRPSGGTPGLPNSLLIIPSEGKKEIEISPNPFSPDHDGWEDICSISISSDQPVMSGTLDLFNRNGLHVRRLTEVSEHGKAVMFLWDGLHKSGHICPIGPYIGIGELKDDSGKSLMPFRVVIYLAARM